MADECPCMDCQIMYDGGVTVPVKGEYFVRDGKIIKVLESELMEPGSEDWAWRVWTEPQGDER